MAGDGDQLGFFHYFFGSILHSRVLRQDRTAQAIEIDFFAINFCRKLDRFQQLRIASNTIDGDLILQRQVALVDDLKAFQLVGAIRLPQNIVLRDLAIHDPSQGLAPEGLPRFVLNVHFQRTRLDLVHRSACRIGEPREGGAGQHGEAEEQRGKAHEQRAFFAFQFHAFFSFICLFYVIGKAGHNGAFSFCFPRETEKGHGLLKTMHYFSISACFAVILSPAHSKCKPFFQKSQKNKQISLHKSPCISSRPRQSPCGSRARRRIRRHSLSRSSQTGRGITAGLPKEYRKGIDPPSCQNCPSFGFSVFLPASFPAFS